MTKEEAMQHLRNAEKAEKTQDHLQATSSYLKIKEDCLEFLGRETLVRCWQIAFDNVAQFKGFQRVYIREFD